MRYPAILAAAAAVIGTATVFITPAVAGTPVERVPYGDLKLTTAEGQAQLQKRLNSAAWRVCMFDERGNLRSGEQQGACYRNTRKNVAVQLAQVLGDTQRGG